MSIRPNAVLVLGLLALASVDATAQVVGQFRWQLLPYCNVLTLIVTQAGAAFTLDGFDDQCGGSAPRGGTTGMAFFNADGTIGMGLTTVRAPGGTAVHTEASVSLATVSGSWRDSAGNTGAFVFTPGAAAGGAVRPVAANGLPPASITATTLASGAVTSSKLAANAVGDTAQIEPNTIEFSDVKQLFLIGTSFSQAVAAQSCVARESTSAGVAAVAMGDLLVANPQNVPIGVYTVPVVAGAPGRFGMMICNATTSPIPSTSMGFGLLRIPK